MKRILLGLLLLILTHSTVSYALSDKDVAYRDVYFRSLLEDQGKLGESLSEPRASDYFSVPENERESLKTCYNSYASIFKTAKSTIDIRIAMGYVDVRDGEKASRTNDPIFRAAFVEHLLKPCPEGEKPTYFACGFTRDEDDADLMIKKVKGLDNLEKTVRLRITNGSAIGDDDINCNRKSGTFSVCKPTESQKEKTSVAHANYTTGLASADVVFYMGHSRSGGGPDFTPPLLSKGGYTDEQRYTREGRKSYNETLRILRKPTTDPPKMIGFFSCDSNHWFKSGVLAASPKSGFIGTTQNTYQVDNFVGVTGALDSILGMRCEKDFAASIATPREGKAQHVLSNFFKPQVSTAAATKTHATAEPKHSSAQGTD